MVSGEDGPKGHKKPAQGVRPGLLAAGLPGRLFQMCIKGSKMGEDWLRTDYTHI